MSDIDEQIRQLTYGCVDLISEAELRRKLERGTPLRVKLGIDPTRPDIHLGFAVVLRVLRRFQDFGHTAVLIVGDQTAQIGDPSGKSATRPRLSKEEVDANAQSYFDQLLQILSPERLEIRRNSEWLASMDLAGVLNLASRATVARMLERDDFAKRYASGIPISVMELLYPLMQGWDSVMVQADIELGGTDQLFNNLMGRPLQEQEGQEAQVVMTMPLLVGLDGVNKMSKSLDNYVGITEAPNEMFGKLMSISDALMPSYFTLTTGWAPDRIDSTLVELTSGALKPNAAKRMLARAVIDCYHGDGAGAAAEAEFDRVFKAHARPTDIAEHVVARTEFDGDGIRLAKVLALCGLVASNKEGRRMIEQGGVRCNDEKISDPDCVMTGDALDGVTLQVGRRNWAVVRVQ